MANLIAACILLTAAVVAYAMRRARPVYLLDFHVFKPRDDLKMPSATFLQHTRRCKVAPGHPALGLRWRACLAAKAGKHLMRLMRAGLLALQGFTPESITFQEKMVAKGGLGDETYLPEGALHRSPRVLLHARTVVHKNTYTQAPPCSPSN